VKDERVYLGHLRDAINDIEKYTSAGRDAFMSERMRQSAMEVEDVLIRGKKPFDGMESIRQQD
jgi:uncharacterized protein with HEPN domain